MTQARLAGRVGSARVPLGWADCVVRWLGPHRRPQWSGGPQRRLPLTQEGSPFLQITAQQMAAQGQAQKVTYATQPALKTQFLTTPISQAQKLAGSQQVQTQIQVRAGGAAGG